MHVELKKGSEKTLMSTFTISEMVDEFWGGMLLFLFCTAFLSGRQMAHGEWDTYVIGGVIAFFSLCCSWLFGSNAGLMLCCILSAILYMPMAVLGTALDRVSMLGGLLAGCITTYLVLFYGNTPVTWEWFQFLGACFLVQMGTWYTLKHR